MVEREESRPKRDWRKWDEPIIVTGVTVAFIVVVAVSLWVFYYAIPGVMSGLFPPDTSYPPHTYIKSFDQEASIDGLPEPVGFQVLGNASGQQVLLILGTDGTMSVHWSDDLFSSNHSSQDLLHVSDIGEVVSMGLGWSERDRPTARVAFNEEVLWWAIDIDGTNWTRVDPPTTFQELERPPFVSEDLPHRRAARLETVGWDSVRLDDLDIYVGSYLFSSGCMEGPRCPSVVYRDDSGHWSTIVAFGESRASQLRVAGIGVDDMFIVANNGAHWALYPILGSQLTDYAEAPAAIRD